MVTLVTFVLITSIFGGIKTPSLSYGIGFNALLSTNSSRSSIVRMLASFCMFMFSVDVTSVSLVENSNVDVNFGSESLKVI